MKSIYVVSFICLLTFAAAPCSAQKAQAPFINSIEPSTLHIGIEPSTLHVGIEPATLHIGIEPSTLHIGIEPSTLHIGIEPASLHMGIEPSGLGPNGSQNARMPLQVCSGNLLDLPSARRGLVARSVKSVMMGDFGRSWIFYLTNFTDSHIPSSSARNPKDLSVRRDHFECSVLIP
jgi:hypothetical protein